MDEATPTTLEKIQAAVARYGWTATQEADCVAVKNKKAQTVARVKDGQVEQVFSGKQNLCGALAKREILAAIK